MSSLMEPVTMTQNAGVHPRVLPQPPTSSRLLHKAAAITCAVLLLLSLLLIAAHAVIAYTLAYPYVAPLTSNPMLAKELPYVDLQFPSASGKSTVHGWYIPSQEVEGSKRTIVLSHGYGANREEIWVPMYELAALLNGLTFNVLMFDYGYASEASRMPATGGIEEAQQLLASVAKARELGAEQTIVWGFSMGAGTALQAALQSDSIDALILDSTFIADAGTLYHNLSQHVSLPRYPTVPLIEQILPLWTGVRMNQIPSEQVRSTSYDIPMLIVHGTADTKAPVHIAEAIAANQTHPLSSSWIVQDGIHEMIFRLHSEEYISLTLSFLGQVDDWLAGSS